MLAVVCVTANPEIETILLKGLTTNVVTVESPRPELLEVFTVVIKNDPLTVVGATATDEAATGGTACQVGVAPEPAEVKTYPEFELAVNLPQVFVVLA